MAAGQYLGTGGLTMVGQLVPILQVGGVVCDYGVIFTCAGGWVRNHDHRVLARYLLLHHHRLDSLLPDQHHHQHTGVTLENLW